MDYELLNPFCFGALPSLGLPRISAQYKFLYIIIFIIIRSSICKQLGWGAIGDKQV